MKKTKCADARTPTLWAQMREKRIAFLAFWLLMGTALAVVVIGIVQRRWDNVFHGVLTAVFAFIPLLLQGLLRVRFPATLEILAYLFVFATQFLGEVADLYRLVPGWDAMLHTVSGFMFAALGFSLGESLHRNREMRFALSPMLLAVLAVCFSVSVGVLWEFFEVAADTVLHTDMQKDVLRDTLHTVSIPNELGQKVTHLEGITTTVITTADGRSTVLDGFLDMGVADTMKDLFLNTVGALVFGVIGYFYVKNQGKGRFAAQFIPTLREQKTADADAPKARKE
ncbi:MAG: hypothetical protein IJA78_05000 [Clostridia bacterium]|nr:hypothetical protein [Clostridia bacterium]